MQVTLVTSNTKLVATSKVGPTFQCLPRPATRELLYNCLSLSLHHQHTHNFALRWPWP